MQLLKRILHSDEVGLELALALFEYEYENPSFFFRFMKTMGGLHSDPAKLKLFRAKKKFNTDTDFVTSELKNSMPELLKCLNKEELGLSWKNVKDTARSQQLVMQKRILARINNAKSALKARMFIWFAVASLTAHKQLFTQSI